MTWPATGARLLTRDHKRGEIIGLPPGESSERDLSWLDRSVAIDLSADGRKLLLSEVGAGGGESKAVYIRQRTARLQSGSVTGRRRRCRRTASG